MTDVSVLMYIAAALVGYLVGSLNPAATIARLRGVDLRHEGSGNPGATNAARTMGRGVGIAVGLLDVLKGFIPAIVFTHLGGELAGELAGVAAVLGHITSPFLKGRGGKGVATALGAILGTHAWWALPVLAAFAITVAVTRRVGLGAVAAAIVLIPTAIVMTDSWHARLMAVLIALLILVRHRANIESAIVQARGAVSGNS